MLADTIARIAADLCPPSAIRADEAGQPASALWSAIADAGLDRATAPESAGGSALSWREVLPLVIACGEHALPVPLADSLGAHALASAAGCSLPPGGASFALLGRAPDGLLAADAVSWGDRVVSVVGVLPDGELFVLDSDGVQNEPQRNAAGEWRSSMTWQGGGRRRGRLADPGAVIELGAALRAAELAGAMRAILRMTVRYAGDREQFGRPIGRFQAVQQQLALMAELVAQASIGAELAFDCEGPLFDPVRAGCAKQVASANALQCAAIAHAVHGAIGVTAEYDLQLYTRRLRVWAAEWGGAHHWALALGRRALRGKQESLWHAVIEGSTSEGSTAS
jgi:acyl-CoA dehydrogenase